MTPERAKEYYLIERAELESALIAIADDEEDKEAIAWFKRIESRPATGAALAELDRMFPENTKINSNGDLNGGWELDPKSIAKLVKQIEIS